MPVKRVERELQIHRLFHDIDDVMRRLPDWLQAEKEKFMQIKLGLSVRDLMAIERRLQKLLYLLQRRPSVQMQRKRVLL